MSYPEAKQYLEVGYNSIKARVAPTAYAVVQRAYASDSDYTSDGKAAGWWWLRSPGYNQNQAANVNTNGSLGYDYVYYASEVVRPALWLNLEADIF